MKMDRVIDSLIDHWMKFWCWFTEHNYPSYTKGTAWGVFHVRLGLPCERCGASCPE